MKVLTACASGALDVVRQVGSSTPTAVRSARNKARQYLHDDRTHVSTAQPYCALSCQGVLVCSYTHDGVLYRFNDM